MDILFFMLFSMALKLFVANMSCFFPCMFLCYSLSIYCCVCITFTTSHQSWIIYFLQVVSKKTDMQTWANLILASCRPLNLLISFMYFFIFFLLTLSAKILLWSFYSTVLEKWMCFQTFAECDTTFLNIFQKWFSYKLLTALNRKIMKWH